MDFAEFIATVNVGDTFKFFPMDDELEKSPLKAMIGKELEALEIDRDGNGLHGHYGAYVTFREVGSIISLCFYKNVEEKRELQFKIVSRKHFKKDELKYDKYGNPKVVGEGVWIAKIDELIEEVKKHPPANPMGDWKHVYSSDHSWHNPEPFIYQVTTDIYGNDYLAANTHDWNNHKHVTIHQKDNLELWETMNEMKTWHKDNPL